MFSEKPEYEFLLTETEDLTDELLTEFPEWLEKHKIGEYTHKGQQLELIQFKEQLPYDPVKISKKSSMLIDGAHHSRELITIKMTFSILLKLLHGVYYGDS